MARSAVSRRRALVSAGAIGTGTAAGCSRTERHRDDPVTPTETTADRSAPGAGASAIHDAVASGQPVALGATDGTRSVAWSDHETDDGALRALVEWIAGRDVRGGAIHVPATKPGGEPIVIEEQVLFGSNENHVPISVYFYESNRYEAPIETTIDDGSVMFRFGGNPGRPIRTFEVLGGTFNGGGNDVTFWEFQNGINWHAGGAFDMDSFTGTGINIDSASYAWSIGQGRMKARNKEATGITFSWKTDVGGTAPGNGIIGANFHTTGEIGESIQRKGVGGPPVVISCYLEGAHGNAMIDLHRGQNIVTPQCQLKQTSDGAHGIFASGHRNVLAPSHMQLIDGDGIHVTGGASFLIWPHIDFAPKMGGEAIRVTGAPALKGVVPYEECIQRGATYPDPPWDESLRYTDGRRLLREGTATLDAGGSAVVEKYAGGAGTETDVTWWFENEPTGTVDVVESRGWNGADGNQTVRLSEESGDGDVDVGYRVLTR
jgi:hypothetical protein